MPKNLIYVFIVLVRNTTDEISCKLRAMSGTDHRRKLAAMHRCIAHIGRKTADPAITGEIFGRLVGSIGVRTQRLGRRPRNTRFVQRNFDTSVTIATSCQGPRFRLGKCDIVDISRRNASRDNIGDRRWTFVDPAPLGHFALQIIAKSGLSRRETTDIVQRKRIQRRRIEGA